MNCDSGSLGYAIRYSEVITSMSANHNDKGIVQVQFNTSASKNDDHCHDVYDQSWWWAYNIEKSYFKV